MSRFVALAAALSLLVSGILIGALGAFIFLERPNRFGEMHPPPPPHGPPQPPQGPPPPFTREMEERLDLTDEQWDKIQVILKESRDESETIRKELRPRLEKNLKSTQDRIAALLTPAQRKTFDALVRENARRAQRFFLEGPPPPGGPHGGPGGPFPPGPPPFRPPR